MNKLKLNIIKAIHFLSLIGSFVISELYFFSNKSIDFEKYEIDQSETQKDTNQSSRPAGNKLRKLKTYFRNTATTLDFKSSKPSKPKGDRRTLEATKD